MPDGAPQIGTGSINQDIVAGRIGALLAEHRPNAAKPLLAALAKLAPEHEKLPLLRANYWCEMRDIPQALAVLQEAIGRAPSNAALWFRQAEIFFAVGQSADAVQSAAQTVLLAPDSCAAKSRLGLALTQLGQFDQALPCLAESFSAQPANAEVALALAALLPATATETLNRAIIANPRITVLRNALLRRYLCEYLSGGNIEAAMRLARQAIGEGIADAQTHCLLAFAQIETAQWNEAAVSAARAQSIAAENPWAERLVAALSSRKSGRLIQAAQEDAGIAEQALIAGGTIAPGTFRSLIEESELSGPVLDLFCGTGLNAVAAQGINTGPWIGIDPRPALVARCAEYGLYASLRQSDPLDSIAGSTEYPVILLNEALARMESPQPFLSAIRPHLASSGIALAAIPTGRPGLSGHGLYTHREAAMAQYAAGAGLSFETPRSGILRHLEGLPIHGVIAVFRPL